MSSLKLTCPECETVLRPSKPVAPGKKVKCPKCETVFSAPRAEEEDDKRPGKSGAKKAGATDAKKEVKPAVKKTAEEEESEGTYGYVKDPDEGDASKKPKIRYGPDTSIVDPRGPATVKLAGPANTLQLAGLVGTLGWVMFTTLIIFPAVFPINPEVRVYVLNKPPTGFGGLPPPVVAGEKAPPQAPPFFIVYGFSFYTVIEQPWFLFIPAMLPFLLLGCCSAIIVGGGIQMQNLESRQFGFIGAVLAILPLNVLGLNLLLALLLHYLSWMILEETELGMWVSIGVNVVLYLLSVAAGGWSIATLVDPEVIEGFEFVPRN